MSVIRSIAFYIAFYLGSVVYVLGTMTALESPARLRRICDGWSRWHRRCVTGLLGIEVRWEGEMLDGPALYVMKHEAFFEAIDMPEFFDYPAPFGKKELFAIPGWGKAAETYGGIEVARDEGAKALRKMLKLAKQRVSEGRPLVLFPEGTRVAHGTRPPLKSGFAALYKMLGVPVVPVAVNSGPLYHRLWKRRGTITYRFADPIPAGLEREEAERLVHEAINALNAPAPEEP
ncbi:lysophospholipid acyltransferase family protein [Alteraurantiacibacter aquimixticola]|uniref:1-acyl-sn-glycerol-3-phosphate acyltransferase n=1 Tax=Alteraurantiacibacter aquimixticola TaxID=2489173 RepID=A0A4V4U8D3_9SPHN|nr:lysophospholipid acyltransferase family protein [Alteraurantiacibacter aquimixticola]TIX49470.1 1-acyl-sn-glycerol-3-phosphate acyltransferase [Alteraurantiacibacter aquimixticola]